jgi:ribonuclease P protein component
MLDRALGNRMAATSETKEFSFPKSLRLLYPHQFRRVMKYGYRVSGKYLIIHLCESNQSSLKLGITVSRKFGKSVERNYFKRLVREAFRLSQKQLPPFLHLNIYPQKTPVRPTLQAIQEELLSLIAE